MSETEVYATLETAAVEHNTTPFEDDEPPSTPRRHQAWKNVPKK